MRRSTALLFVVLVALSSCATRNDTKPDGYRAKFQCPVPPEHVVVSVINNNLAVLPETVCVGNVNANPHVRWVLDAVTAKDYKFDADGITFEEPPFKKPTDDCSTPPPDSDFDLDSKRQCKQVKDDQVHCTRMGKPKQGACYKYTVTLTPKKLGGPVLKLPVLQKDPWILNE